MCNLIKFLFLALARNASGERMFSALKRIKTYLKNSYGQARLNHLIVIHVY